jgi:hypothetical protein
VRAEGPDHSAIGLSGIPAGSQAPSSPRLPISPPKHSHTRLSTNRCVKTLHIIACRLSNIVDGSSIDNTITLLLETVVRKRSLAGKQAKTLSPAQTANAKPLLRRASASQPRRRVGAQTPCPREGRPAHSQSFRLIAPHPYQRVPAAMVRGALRDRAYGEGRLHLVGR